MFKIGIFLMCFYIDDKILIILILKKRGYFEKYGIRYTSVVPTNIYGSNDNFNLKDSHVIPGLVHKCYNAKSKYEIKF